MNDDDWKELDKLIERFEFLVQAGRPGSFSFVSRNWGDIWALAKRIQDAAKVTRYPTREERQAAWERFQSLREEASRDANAERERLAGRSADHKAEILRLARRGTRKFLDVPTHELLKAFAEELGRGRQYLSDHKQEMTKEDKDECFEALREAQDDLDANFKQRREEAAEEWRKKVQANLEKNQELLRAKEAQLAHMEASAQELRGNIASAWNPGYAERASGWLEELEEKIRGLEEFIEKIKEWIEDGENKLNT